MQLLRARMEVSCEAQRPLLGIVEADESYFGARELGAAITDAAGNGVAAINISVPHTRWNEKLAMADFSGLIRETARAISVNIREKLS